MKKLLTILTALILVFSIYSIGNVELAVANHEYAGGGNSGDDSSSDDGSTGDPADPCADCSDEEDNSPGNSNVDLSTIVPALAIVAPVEHASDHSPVF